MVQKEFHTNGNIFGSNDPQWMFEDYKDDDFVFIKEELLEYDDNVIGMVEMLLKERMFTKLEDFVGDKVAQTVIMAILKITTTKRSKNTTEKDLNEAKLVSDFKEAFKINIDPKVFQAKQYIPDQNLEKKSKSRKKKNKKKKNSKKKNKNSDIRRESTSRSDHQISEKIFAKLDEGNDNSIRDKKSPLSKTESNLEQMPFHEKKGIKKTKYKSSDHVIPEIGNHEIIKMDYPFPSYILCGNPVDGYYSLRKSDEGITIQESFNSKDQLIDCPISGFSISKYEEDYFKSPAISSDSDSNEIITSPHPSGKINIEMADLSHLERKIEKRLEKEELYTEDAIFEITQNISDNNSYENTLGVKDASCNPLQKTTNVFKFKNKLPIHKYTEEIVEKVVKNRITIISGDTGCGKTTQVPQILLKIFNKVIISLPKKVAAISVAQRVAEELDVRLGSTVGYKVRWDEKSSDETKILFVTDGILSLECLNGNISNYDIIVIDEFHERKMDYDFIISYFLINQLKKLLLMSATINLDKYKDLFKAATIQIPVRTFPNTICYLKDSNYNYEKEIVEIIAKICQKYEHGDILVFLPGIREIDNVAVQIKNTIAYDHKLIKLSSSYSTKCQMQIFEKTIQRKIILSTNIAESSITVNDLMFVIDSGQVRRNIIRWQAESLETMKISKSSADQRAGRVGRVGPGTVFRLYTKNDYSIFEQDLVPDTVCSDITPLILKFLMANLDFTVCMKLLGYSRIKYYKDACLKLTNLNCIDEEGKLTEIGRTISKIPLKVELAKTILKSIELGVLCDVAIICGFLEVDRVFYDDRKLRNEIQFIIKSKSEDIGDHIAYLNLYLDGFKQNFSKKFCSKYFIKQSAILEVKKISEQILRRISPHSLPIKLKNLKKSKSIQKIIIAFCDGFRLNIAKRTGNYYTRLRDSHLKVNIFGGSSLQYQKPDLVLYNKLIHTSQFLMKDCIKIESKDLLQIDGAFELK